MWDILPTLAIAAAGGMGFLAVQHPKQYNEMVPSFLITFALIGFTTFVIHITMEIVISDFKYEVPADNRDAAAAGPEKWKSRFGYAFLWCGAALLYLLMLMAISESIMKDRNSDLQKDKPDEDDAKVPKSD